MYLIAFVKCMCTS